MVITKAIIAIEMPWGIRRFKYFQDGMEIGENPFVSTYSPI